ncbi:PucR family transcriptional regulator ligand-binding domain-containing protein [Eggerthella lenta]|uniref:PucR family transcriptional regulator ligand-binding domain-containing protein n=1 Tax=Eggerthella lenta TaxID=84112 RepID=UPI001F3CE413|nr:PucR family transcriptional regulator ligand-binding domain-containing protein [Eggerthella lenta]
MVTVADIIALPAFKNVELVAPCEGAERREVRNVGILDCPPDYNEYSVYVAGELILTNLGFAFGNPGMAEKSLLTMLRRDVAAIAVKTVYEPPISDAVRKESTARGVPLYLYDGAYHETVAYQSLDLLQRDRDELDKGKALDELLNRPRRRPGAYEAERARGRDGLEAAVLRVRPARGRPVLVLRHARLGVLWAGDGEGRVRDRRVGQRVPLPRSYPGVRILRLGQR